MKRLSITIRDYTFRQVFPLLEISSKLNKSERIEELISKGLQKEKEDLAKK